MFYMFIRGYIKCPCVWIKFLVSSVDNIEVNEWEIWSTKMCRKHSFYLRLYSPNFFLCWVSYLFRKWNFKLIISCWCPWKHCISHWVFTPMSYQFCTSTQYLYTSLAEQPSRQHSSTTSVVLLLLRWWVWVCCWRKLKASFSSMNIDPKKTTRNVITRREPNKYSITLFILFDK